MPADRVIQWGDAAAGRGTLPLGLPTPAGCGATAPGDRGLPFNPYQQGKTAVRTPGHQTSSTRLLRITHVVETIMIPFHS